MISSGYGLNRNEVQMEWKWSGKLYTQRYNLQWNRNGMKIE